MRRLQQELSQERDKYNQLLQKYQDLQQQYVDDQQLKNKMNMEIDCKATEIEHLQSKLNETASLSSADNDPEDSQVQTTTLTHKHTHTYIHIHMSGTHTHIHILSLSLSLLFARLLRFFSTHLCSHLHRTRSLRAG